ncbi:MAG TPA: Bcr/CflA family multidrug efflux MFS transporter [Victivallales bacterium]|nr:Bcr/CflA family multidrug efflux MFS transporter [Victivallales bacterium]
MNKNKIRFDLILLLGILSMLTPMAIDMYIPALGKIAFDLNSNSTQIQFSLQTYLIGYAAGQFIYGPLSDSFGRRPILIIGIALFIITNIFIFMCYNGLFFNILRIFQGIGGASASVISITLVKDIFDRDKFARTMSIISLVMLCAPIISPTIGAHILIWFGWRYIFALLCIISLVALIAILLILPETRAKNKRKKFEFNQLLNNYGIVIKNKVALYYMLCNAFALSGVFCFITSGSLVYNKIYRLSPEIIGYLFGINIIFSFLFTILNSHLVCKLGSKNLFIMGLTIQLVSSITMCIFYTLHIFDIYGFVIGIGFYVGINTSIYSNAIACALQELPSEITGTAVALSGVLCFSVAPTIGSLLATFPVNSAMPMIFGMLLCSICSISLYILTEKRIKLSVVLNWKNIIFIK